MRQIISIIYGVLMIAVWICVMGIVIAVLDGGDPQMLVAGGFVAAVSTVAVAQEFVEWRSHPRTSHITQSTVD